MFSLYLYLVVKFVHVLSAIVAVGANATYGVWFARAAQHPQFAPFALRGIKFIDDRIANPAYGLLLLTGLGLAGIGGYFSLHWIQAALGLYVLMVLVAVIFYSPTLKRQIEAVDREGFGSPEASRLASRGTRIGAVIWIFVVAILILMIFKPIF